MNGMERYMSNKKIIFATGEGVGNVLQTLPCLRTLKEVLNYEVDFWHAFGAFYIPKNLIPYINNYFRGSEISRINPNDYSGLVSTFWTRNHLNIPALKQLKLLNSIQPLSAYHSEVDTYMDIARDLGAKEEDLLWYGKCNYKEADEKYDVVIHNGYKRDPNLDWSVKSYPYYREVVKLLKGLRICSVGAKNEYIEGTENRTGLDLLDSLGIIKNCKVFLGNDSGLYHCANALGVKNVVIFTATSIDKNYDKRFHKYSTLVYRNDLDCRPCQGNRGWKKCKTWECREIHPQAIVNAIEEKINES